MPQGFPVTILQYQSSYAGTALAHGRVAIEEFFRIFHRLAPPVVNTIGPAFHFARWAVGLSLGSGEFRAAPWQRFRRSARPRARKGTTADRAILPATMEGRDAAFLGHLHSSAIAFDRRRHAGTYPTTARIRSDRAALKRLTDPMRGLRFLVRNDRIGVAGNGKGRRRAWTCGAAAGRAHSPERGGRPRNNWTWLFNPNSPGSGP